MKTWRLLQDLPETSHKSGSAPAAPTAPVKAAAELNAGFRFLKEADKQVSSNCTIDVKNRRNIFWLAKGALGLHDMMKAQERREVKGKKFCLKDKTLYKLITPF